jgi:ABC-type nitrate/sulfonate/bicarbonate transport system permease component
MISQPRVKQALQAAASTIVLLAAWQVASLFFPHYLFPPVQAIFWRTAEILVDVPLLIEVLVTAARIFGGLLGAFLLGCVLAVLIGRSPFIESYFTPVLVFLQGIPALSWVVIAIIWFHGIEFRILFIMVITTLPAFTFQILDAYRSMSKDLFEMTMSFRPRSWTLFRVLIVPTIVPGILNRLEGQPRQRGTRGRGRRTGRGDRRGRLPAAAPAAIVRHGGRYRLDLAARAVRACRADGDRGDRELGAALPAGRGTRRLMP